MDIASNVVQLKPRPKPKPPRHSDRNFFLILLLIIWGGILMGFGGDIARHYAKSGLNYPLIVHVHAAAYVGWMGLLTVQIGLIRAGNYRVHKALGVFGAGLAVAMVILGPTAEIIVGRINYGQPDSDPAFQAIAFAGVGLFGLMTGAAILMRKQSDAHKRLIMLGIIAICNAGFSRWLGGPLFHVTQDLLGHTNGPPVVAAWASAYLIPTVLMLSIGIYDLITRRRLVMAWVWGALVCFLVEVASIGLYLQPWWLTVAQHILGH